MDGRIMDPKGRKCFKREWMINHLSQIILSQINEGRELTTGFNKVEIISDPDRRVLVDLYLLC